MGGVTEKLKEFDRQMSYRRALPREQQARDRSLRGKARRNARKNKNKGETVSENQSNENVERTEEKVTETVTENPVSTFGDVTAGVTETPNETVTVRTEETVTETPADDAEASEAAEDDHEGSSE